MGDGIRYRPDKDSYEAKLLVPREMRQALGKTYLYFYGKKKSEVKRRRNEAMSKLLSEGPTSINSEKLTFGEWLERWLDGPAKAKTHGTHSFYVSTARRYLIPPLGSVRLRDLTAEHLDELYRDLRLGKPPAKRPLQPTSIGHVHGTARVALQHAAKKRLIPFNPAQYADPPQIQKKKRTTISADDLESFFAAAAGERLEAMWILWVLTGLRPGEIYGLKWEDLRDEEILVRRSWSATWNQKAYMRDTTKTGKGRPVILLSPVNEALKLHRTRYLEELVHQRPVWEALWKERPEFRDLIFPQPNGAAQNHWNLNRGFFKPLLEKAGLPPMRPYDLRHTFGTLWVESGESAEVLQKILGHSSIRMTIDTYTHISPRYQRESFGRFGAQFEKHRGTNRGT